MSHAQASSARRLRAVLAAAAAAVAAAAVTLLLAACGGTAEGDGFDDAVARASSATSVLIDADRVADIDEAVALAGAERGAPGENETVLRLVMSRDLERARWFARELQARGFASTVVLE